MAVVDNDDAFDSQNTCELRNAAYRFAKLRVRYIRDAGQPVPKSYATELVSDALIDTRVGIVRWDPTRCELLAHIRGLFGLEAPKKFAVLEGLCAFRSAVRLMIFLMIAMISLAISLMAYLALCGLPIFPIERVRRVRSRALSFALQSS